MASGGGLPAALREARGAWRRRTRSPFAADRGRALLVHCTHHKAGTVWVRRVLTAVAADYGLRIEVLWAEGPRPGTDIAFIPEARHFDRAWLAHAGFRGSHMVRDPRDMIVSGYHYHLWTDEDWANSPAPEYGGLTYRQHLNQLDRDAGLLAEIRRSVTPGANLDEMMRWDYGSPDFLELRYEDFIADDKAQFTRLFRHYGFTDEATARAVGTAERFNFKSVSARNVGEEMPGNHLRSGRPGEWRDHFGPGQRAAFKEATGDLLVRLGYEAGEDW